MATPPTPLPGISPEAPGAPPAKKSQNVLVWVLGGCGTVLVLLVIVGALAFRSFMKNNIHVGPDGSVDMKFGPMTMHGGKPQDVGLQVYPGVETAGAMGMEMTLPTAKYGTQIISQAIYNSKDPVEKVDDWYHENLSAEFIRLDAGKNQAVLGDKAFPMPLDFGAISYSSKHGDTRYAVTIHAIMGTTQIKLMRSNAPQPKAQ
jgi:hypothetical protein